MHSIRSILFFLLIFLAVLLVSCHGEDLVDDELDIYLERFQEEAAMRNITIDYERRPIEARLEVHAMEVALGWCNYDFDTQNKVTINLVFWDVLDDLGKEKLIFHELGHCILNRQHLDRIRGDGFCKSIMHSGQACADNYSPDTREAYLDELFTRK